MANTRKHRTRYALLGLLTIGPMSGYEMKKFIASITISAERSEFFNATLSFSQKRSVV